MSDRFQVLSSDKSLNKKREKLTKRNVFGQVYETILFDTYKEGTKNVRDRFIEKCLVFRKTQPDYSEERTLFLLDNVIIPDLEKKLAKKAGISSFTI